MWLALQRDVKPTEKKKLPLKVMLSAQRRLNRGNGSIRSRALVLQMTRNQRLRPRCAGKTTEQPRKSERETCRDLVTALASPREKR